MAYTASLNLAAKACRFDACQPHQIRAIGEMGNTLVLGTSAERLDGFESLIAHHHGGFRYVGATRS